MKKITSILALACFSTFAIAQSQRFELYEEFSGENCDPCAATNPGFNAVLQQYNNVTKIAAIKYESPIPSSAGPASLYGQDMADVNTRNTYYANTAAPEGWFDGYFQPDTSGQAYQGWPGILQQYNIDTASKVNSPFTFTITHSFSPMYDSVFVHLVVTASMNYTANGALYLRLALVEAQIHLAAPTGSNGEKDFYNTMRKMIPSALGTALAGTWTNGQSSTFDFAVKIPAYIYDKEQIAFVGFIQSDGDKAVQQAALSSPIPMVLDAGVKSVYNIPSVQCSLNYTAMDTIYNFGTTTLTSCTINYSLDAGTTMTQAWTGSIPAGGTAVVTLPVATTVPGAHSLKVWTTLPNGLTDYNPGNDAASIRFTVEGASGVAPLVQGFGTAPFPPTGWAIVTDPPSPNGWTRSTSCGSFGVASALGAAKVDFNGLGNGTVTYMYLHNLDLSGSATTAALTFDVAYAPLAANQYDQLDVELSTDCGVSWNNVYSKSGSGLATAPADNTTFFVPTAAQWRTEAVNLNTFAGQTNVLMRFTGTSGQGNNLFIDNINLSNSQLGISEHNLQNNLSVFPNPFTDNVQVAFNLLKADNVKMTLYNMMGQMVYSADQGLFPAGASTINFNGSQLSGGMYFMTITSGDYTVSRKVTVSK